MALKFVVGQHVTAPRLGYLDSPREPGVVTHVSPYLVCVHFPRHNESCAWGYTDSDVTRWHISQVLPAVLKPNLEVTNDSI